MRIDLHVILFTFMFITFMFDNDTFVSGISLLASFDIVALNKKQLICLSLNRSALIRIGFHLVEVIAKYDTRFLFIWKVSI